jgi:hypothetical protein
MKVAIMASLFAEWYVDVDSGHKLVVSVQWQVVTFATLPLTTTF